MKGFQKKAGNLRHMYRDGVKSKYTWIECWEKYNRQGMAKWQILKFKVTEQMLGRYSCVRGTFVENYLLPFAPLAKILPLVMALFSSSFSESKPAFLAA